MVGIVLVSHSRVLAQAVQELVRSMTGPVLRLAIAAGVGDDHRELGTDAVEISEAIVSVQNPDGVLVLMDMGSAILSAETALDLLDDAQKANVRFCAAPFVEGAVASGVTANLGSPLETVYAEAIAALKQKEAALGHKEPTALAKSEATCEEVPPGSSGLPIEKIRLTVRNVHGLHARPAALLITETRPFASEIMVRNLGNQRGPVSIKSLSALASLEIVRDTEIEVMACGEDASAALGKIRNLVESGIGDAIPTTNNKAEAKSHPVVTASSLKRKTDSAPLAISSGITIGNGFYFQAGKIDIPLTQVQDTSSEIVRLRTAVSNVQKSLQARCEQMSATIGSANAGIYDAQILALQDPELVENAAKIIRDEKTNAALAWDRANRQIVARYESLKDPYLRERAADLEDVGQQVLESLADKELAMPRLDQPGILVADNLTPGQVSSLNRKLILGVVLLDGGPTAHSSILLRALGIPALAQARYAFAGIDWSQPTRIAFDGSTGKTWINPDAGFLNELRNLQVAERKRNDAEQEAASLPGATRDGHRIEIFANIGSAADVENALHSGAEGVGLLRTEFLFLDRDSAPTEKEQLQALLAVAEKIKGKPLIVRTLDAGGDKELPYLRMATEENPFLGVRAIRLCFSHEELFTTHLRAILRAGVGHDVRIMFPMIAHLDDLQRAKQYLLKVHLDLEKENIPHLWPVPTGIMIEIPSAALQAEALAAQADFFSIGTNDLTQYVLAADRGNPELAAYQDALHPSVLRLIEMVVAGAQKYDRLVAVCGEAASDEKAAAIFAGLGVKELSMTGARISQLKVSLRKHEFTALQRLAKAALQCQSADQVRALSI
jgi:multiphosphoryl transfer protein